MAGDKLEMEAAGDGATSRELLDMAGSGMSKRIVGGTEREGCSVRRSAVFHVAWQSPEHAMDYVAL